MPNIDGTTVQNHNVTGEKLYVIILFSTTALDNCFVGVVSGDRDFTNEVISEMLAAACIVARKRNAMLES